jgi:hypothetical protein
MIDRSVVHGSADDSDDRFDDDSDDRFDDDSDDRFDDDSEDRFFDDNRSSAGRRISIRLGKVTCCGELPRTAT